MQYNIVEWGGERHTDVIATPLLIQQGTAPGHPLFGPMVEAYRQSVYNGREVWRMRDDNYDPAGTEYSRVRVEVVA